MRVEWKLIIDGEIFVHREKNRANKKPIKEMTISETLFLLQKLYHRKFPFYLLLKFFRNMQAHIHIFPFYIALDIDEYK